MRIVIDKDIVEVQLLQESYEKTRRSYKVFAVENGEKFVYGKKLTFNEAQDAVYDLAFDPMFGDCDVEIVGESSNGNQELIWSSDEKQMVSEAAKNANNKNAKGGNNKEQQGGGLWDKIKGAAKGALDKLKGAWNITKQLTGQFSKDMLNKWRNAHYFTKQGEITGLGYKVMTGQAKNTVPAETDDKTGDITKVWEVAKSNATNALKKQGFTINGEIEAFVKNDKDPILYTANVTDKDGNDMKLMLDHRGNAVDGTGVNADNPKEGSPAWNAKHGNDGGNNGGNNANGGGNNGNGGGDAGGNANTQQITPDQAQKNPKAALGNLATRVANLEKEVGIANEATSNNWNFNNEVRTNKAGLERLAIKRFFNEMNDPSVKEIVFVSESGEKKVYSTQTGSTSYSDFKKDFRESTGKAVGKFGEYKITVESGFKSGLKGYKFSSFGLEDDFDSDSRTVVFRESTRKLVSPDDDKDSKKKVNESTVKANESAIDGISKNPEPNGFTLELDKKDPLEEVKALIASMNKYNGVEPKKPDNQDGSIDAGVSTYPDAPTFETPKKQEPLEVPEQKTPKVETPEVVKEAEGDDDAGDDDAGGGADDGGGEADPFAGGDDAGGDDAGGGEADPFAGGDDAGGDDAGGDAGADGGDAGGDPFGGGDDAGGDAGGDAGAEGGDAGGDEATGEPAAPDAVNTDAQGNPKSQYNINVTKPFNSDDNFSLNEEEQKEFFGKIDQLVKIPDMDNYSLYLYQITPENMNLDDVHYIESLYQLSVKLGLLEDIYADSNLLDKYNDYKYSIVKDGEQSGEDELEIKEGNQKNPIWGNKILAEAKESDEKKGISKVQTDNEEKNKESKKIGSSEKDEERRGPKDMKLDLDKNGAPKPVIIDTTKEGWDSLNGKEHGKLVDSTVEGDFHGLGWLVTFKAMQFGSPRYMTMYIKRKGNEKAEKQCEEYLKKLSYTEIDIVKIEEIDPYEYIYRQSCSGMKTPEEIQQASVVNKNIPYLESKEPESIPNDIKRDIKKVITKLNAEIRNTKQFNFMNETGVFKPQVDPHEFMMGYKTAKVDETVSETTYKFVFKKNDSTFSRMFYSNLKEKLFKYLGIFAQKFGLECGCESTPTAITIDFIRSDLGNPGYDLDTMVDTVEEQPVETDNTEEASVAPTLDQALEIAKKM